VNVVDVSVSVVILAVVGYLFFVRVKVVLEIGMVPVHTGIHHCDNDFLRTGNPLRPELGDAGKQDRPCWKTRSEFLDDGTLERLWPSAGGEDEGSGVPESWCDACQVRQKLYEDKSVRQELGKAKIVFWAACRAAEKEAQK
jgi:hypothetical protein